MSRHTAPSSLQHLQRRAGTCLAAWQRSTERWWYDLPAQAGLGCYGTGFDAWGVQTNQKYAAAMAVLATLEGVDGVDRDLALSRALAALRFSLASHVAGPEDVTCTDGRKWGHTWISALGVERMMHGVAVLDAHLADGDRTLVRRMLTSEAGWIYSSHHRGAHHGVFGEPWDRSGKNAPESNLWNGALLWRAAQMYPDEPEADAWRERAHEFLINSVSVPADAEDERIVADKPIRERFRGANFFPNYALDHHGYLNVGYMAICTSNAAILHFDLRRLGLDRPESLDHHQADLWAVLRRMVFSDGRLARIGGDSRVRYAYCQEYLLPSLLYAADHLGDTQALTLADRQFDLIEEEQRTNDDGSFYGSRLRDLAASSPYYYTRLESDRANALSLALAALPMIQQPPRPEIELEPDLAGEWVEPEHGAVLHRSPTRLASFTWRARGLTQALCTPPDDGHLAEWPHNLIGEVRFLGEGGRGANRSHRRVIGHTVDPFPGGFTTCGGVMEGVDLFIPEGWAGTDSAVRHLAVAALPDEHTMVVIQWLVATERRSYTEWVKGLQLNLPNDLFNDFRRSLVTEAGPVELASPPDIDGAIALNSRWAHVAGRVGVVGAYGAETLVVDRSRRRRGGPQGSLYVDELCWGHDRGVRPWEPGATLLDVGYVVVSNVDESRFRRFVAEPELGPLSFPEAPMVRGVSLVSLRDVRRAVLANFGGEEATVTLPSGRTVTLAGGHASVV